MGMVFAMTQLVRNAHICSYSRDWRYHKEEQVWITRVPGMEPQSKSNTYEYGHYYVFNALIWRKVCFLVDILATAITPAIASTIFSIRIRSEIIPL